MSKTIDSLLFLVYYNNYYLKRNIAPDDVYLQIPADTPYTSCSSCGTPRRLYFMCSTCYAKVPNNNNNNYNINNYNNNNYNINIPTIPTTTIPTSTLLYLLKTSTILYTVANCMFYQVKVATSEIQKSLRQEIEEMKSNRVWLREHEVK